MVPRAVRVLPGLTPHVCSYHPAPHPIAASGTACPGSCPPSCLTAGTLVSPRPGPAPGLALSLRAPHADPGVARPRTASGRLDSLVPALQPPPGRLRPADRVA